VEARTADLEAEVAARQGEAARLAGLANAAHVPATQRDWLEWLDTNDGILRHWLREAPVERQQFSRRVTPREGLAAVARLGPKIAKGPPLWERTIAHLPPGYAMLLWQRGASEHKVLCFFCCLSGERRYLPLLSSRPGCNEYFLPAHTDYVAGFLGAACLVAPDGMAIKCAAPLLEHRAPAVVPRAQADAGAADVGDAAVGDGSDCESLLPKMEGGAEEGAEELVHDLDEQGADDDGDDKEGADGGSPSDRALPGTWALFNSGYFALSENPVKYLKMSVLKRWRGGEFMGKRVRRSKAATLEHRGDDALARDRTALVLRAWMLYRAQVNKFAESSPARAIFFFNELETE
ncbi:unnamed protein product, partial [Prorocentrum cordatum]